MRTSPPLLAALAAAALPTLAAAQDRPPALVPTRDVAVTYRMEGGPAVPGATGPQTMRMAWLVAEQKLRVDPPGNQGWVVIDRRAPAAFMVIEAQRIVMRLPVDGQMAQMLRAEPPASARYTRGGTETIAGQRCTVWRFEDGENRGSACLTADGVLLRGEGEGRAEGGAPQRGRLEATEVSYGPADTARFAAPPGYQAMDLPAGAITGGPPRR